MLKQPNKKKIYTHTHKHGYHRFLAPITLYINSRFSEESSSSNTINLERIFKIHSVINIPYHTNPSRHSISDIPSASFQHANYTTNILKPVYTNIEQQSPPTSPTFSTLTENIQNELNILTSEQHFVIDKTYFRNDFYNDKNSDKQTWFFKNFLQQRQNIQKQFYDYVALYKVQILFFDWFELHYASKHHIVYPFASIKHACPITTHSKTLV